MTTKDVNVTLIIAEMVEDGKYLSGIKCKRFIQPLKKADEFQENIMKSVKLLFRWLESGMVGFDELL